MKKLTKSLRKIVVSLVGFPLLALGLVLIPLPGPGLLVCFMAFFILSLEFDWAGRHYETAKNSLIKVYQASKARADRIEKLGDSDKPEKKNKPAK